MWGIETVIGVIAAVAGVIFPTIGGIVWYTSKQNERIEYVRSLMEAKGDKIEKFHNDHSELLEQCAARIASLNANIDETQVMVKEVRNEQRFQLASKSELERVENKVEKLSTKIESIVVEFWRHLEKSGRGSNE
ncbi:hypothetical protein SCBWM1_gp112 [Synechococcus phage S-CBWM1]|uniref:Uncharacterized protein n=1 Tax=Synechococcus phage S-CBWM1 TaxID=2053653 RepID=A0A3G1L3N9_9CAUD|nr:hypothetical protein HOU61_gp085 [Synechococcus phage S-CBWM1]ATW62796.1 hypothetical protein SCBWM1_gp112 [Synechococcus phage S-CBWM1]